MLKKNAEALAGQYGSLVCLMDLIKEESRSEPLRNLDVIPTKLHISSDDKLKKVVIVNEGAGDVVALLGK